MIALLFQVYAEVRVSSKEVQGEAAGHYWSEFVSSCTFIDTCQFTLSYNATNHRTVLLESGMLIYQSDVIHDAQV